MMHQANVPKAVDKILVSSMKETITGLLKTESWVKRHQLTAHLSRLDNAVKKLDYLLGSTLDDSDFAQRHMKTRNSVLGEIYFDPNLPFGEVQNIATRLASKGILKAVKRKAPKDGSESPQHILHPDWKAPIAKLVIGTASFPETANNSPVGCQKHATQAQLLADPSCTSCFRSGLHKVSSDIFNHFFMFRCIKNLDVSQPKATKDIQDLEHGVIANDYPNLVQALQSSKMIRSKSTTPSKTKQLSFGKSKEPFQNPDFTKLHQEFMQYAHSHLASGWTWMVYDPSSNEIRMVNTPNNVCILSHGMWPLLAIDLWEHAFTNLKSTDSLNTQAVGKTVPQYPPWSRAARRQSQGLPLFEGSSYTFAHEGLTDAKQDYIMKFWKHINWNFVEEQIVISKKWSTNHCSVLIECDKVARKVVHDAKYEKKPEVTVESIEEDDIDEDHGDSQLLDEVEDHVMSPEQVQNLENHPEDSKTSSTSGDALQQEEGSSKKSVAIEIGVDQDKDKDPGKEVTEAVNQESPPISAKKTTDLNESDLTEEDLWSEIYEKSFQENALTEDDRKPTQSNTADDEISSMSESVIFDAETDLKKGTDAPKSD